VRRLLTIFFTVLFTLSSVSAHSLHTVAKRSGSAALASPGLLVIDQSDKKVLAENAPDSTRVPASVLKLLTAVVAIQYLGADTRYATSIWKTKNEKKNEYLIRGSFDPFLTTNRAIADKYGHKYLPTLINKANSDGARRINIFYQGLYPKDIYNLSTNLKARKIKAKFTKIGKAQANSLGKEEIYSITSTPLSKMISHLTLWSDNLVADRLANTATRSVGYPTDRKGLTTTFKSVLSGMGVTSEGLKIRDGSGLSKANRVSARTVVELLMAIRNDPRFISIYEGLPISGETGTLVNRFTKAEGAIGKVKAKTGWVNRSVTLAGYVKSGEKEYAFAILADGITPTLQSRNRARTAMDKLLEAIVKGDH
jgi:D-alanyl-D-alanine carboxypeptidase